MILALLLWSGTTLQYLQCMPVVRISAKINETEIRKLIEKIGKTEICFFEKSVKLISLQLGQEEKKGH